MVSLWPFFVYVRGVCVCVSVVCLFVCVVGFASGFVWCVCAFCVMFVCVCV